MLFSACSGNKPTPKPSPTPSETPTPTPSETITPTPTPSVSPTSTPTPSPTPTPTPSPTVEERYKTLVFGHVFNGNLDLSASGGTKEFNGLSFTYSKATFIQHATAGAQIGSKNQPQVNPWDLLANFNEEVTILSYGYTVSCGSSGDFNVTVTLGEDYEEQINCKSTTNKTYEYEDLSIPSSYFKFTLQATQRAIYFNELHFVVEVKEDSPLDFHADEATPIDIIPGDNVPSTKFPVTSKEEYYQGVDLSKTGNELRDELHSRVNNGFTRTSYGDAKTMLIYTDESVEHPGFVYGMWDGDLLSANWNSGTWNREHVWACTNMGLGGSDRPKDDTKNQGSDLHNLRAACPGSNSEHGSRHFGEKGSGYFYPNIEKDSLNGTHAYEGDFRGDLARTLLYMYVCYDFLSLNDNPTGNNDTGVLSTLLSWNTLDPVDDFEIQRNNRVYSYQGNRNPFVDYSTLANSLFY